MTADRNLRIAVVGAGIVGVSAAEWLRRDGHDVVLIDRNQPGQAASFGNGGIIARCSIVPVPVPGLLAKAPGMLLRANQPLFLRWSYLPRLLPWLLPYLASAKRERVVQIAAALAPLVTDAFDEHVALARGTPAEKWLRSSDYIYLYTDRSAFDGDAFGWDLRREHGIVGTSLNRDDLSDLDPGLSETYKFGYALSDHGFIADPGAYVGALAAWFSAQGGRVLRAEVEDIEARPDTATIHTDGETIEVDRVVLAGGAWSADLARRLGHRAMLESERGYHVEFAEPSHTPPCPYMIADAKFVATPMDAGVRAAGIVEFGGLEAGPSRAPTQLLERGMHRLYPNFNYASKREWLGHRPATADSLPLLGPSPKSRIVYFAFGHHHVGMTAGPKSGRLIADMIANRRSNVDLSPYRVERFDR